MRRNIIQILYKILAKDNSDLMIFTCFIRIYFIVVIICYWKSKYAR